MTGPETTEPQRRGERSYRALFAVPSVGRLLAGMLIARIAQSMVSVAIVLFTLSAYGSARLAGLAAFFSLFPGLLVSPLAGALLDRHGRTRLVILDYIIALSALVLIGLLGHAGALPASVLMLITGVASLTMPLSTTGLRSLFPILVPPELWERVNAFDSTGYVVATLVGPPAAAFIVSTWGGPAAFIAIGLAFGVAAIVLIGAPDPRTEATSSGSILTDAWTGLVYTWRNRTLRGLGFSISVLNLNYGVFTIVVPLIILNRLHLSQTVVGLVIAVQGLAGVFSAFLFGRMDSRNRERRMLVLPMIGEAAAIALLLWRSDLITVILVMALTGFLNGPLDIALFTVRQRRTDKIWMGRAFAISMAFNALGLPIGPAAAGLISGISIEAAVLFGAAASLAAGILAELMIE